MSRLGINVICKCRRMVVGVAKLRLAPLDKCVVAALTIRLMWSLRGEIWPVSASFGPQIIQKLFTQNR